MMNMNQNNMKKVISFSKVLSICLCIILMSATVSFAGTSISDNQTKKLSEMTNTELKALINQYYAGNTNDIKVSKLQKAETEAVLESSKPIDIQNTEVYVIQKECGEKNNEKVVIADVAVPIKPLSGGVSSETKEGRVTITCVLGYDRLTRDSISYVKGTYYGGKVETQQIGTAITSIKGTYHESGPYITASGGTGFSSGYTTSTTFSLADNRELQTKSLSRDRYFNTLISTGTVSAKYTATYKVQNSTFEISVNAYAIS